MLGHLAFGGFSTFRIYIPIVEGGMILGFLVLGSEWNVMWSRY